MEFFNSTRGRPKLIHENYSYNLEKTKDEKSRYRCTERKCGGFLLLDQHNSILKSREHNHIPNENDNTTKRIMRHVKRKAEETFERNVDIIINCISELKEQELENLYSYNYMRDQITKLRNKKKGNLNLIFDYIPVLLQKNKKWRAIFSF
jgi:hypothetical protein